MTTVVPRGYTRFWDDHNDRGPPRLGIVPHELIWNESTHASQRGGHLTDQTSDTAFYGNHAFISPEAAMLDKG